MFFWTKPKTSLKDIVWLNRERKYTGIAEQARAHLRDSASLCLIIAHFAETLAALARVFKAQSVPYVLKDRPLYRADVLSSSGAQIFLTRADLLMTRAAQARQPPGQNCRIIGAERFPIPDGDQKIIAFAQSFGIVGGMDCHVALDDPLLIYFIDERITQLLKQIGMAENESLQHDLISRSILNAQRKIAKKARSNRPANSAEQWLIQNVADYTAIISH